MAQTLTPTPSESPPRGRPFSEAPRAPALRMLRRVLSKETRDDMLTTFGELREEYGPIVAHGAGPFRGVFLFGPDANRFVLLDRRGIFSSRKPWMRIMGGTFPNGLLLWDGEAHKHQRKIMREAFKRPMLRSYTSAMNPMIERGLGRFDASAESGAELKAFDALKELTLEIGASVFMGAELGESTTAVNTAFEGLVAASMPGGIRLPIPGLEYQRGLKGRQFMLKFLGSMLAEKRANESPDAFSQMCHAETPEGERFNDTEVLDHMIFLMMAAHDTTTSSLTSMMYELARHPEWQERARAECRTLGKPYAEFEDAPELEELTWVMKETLRRYPPLPVIPRMALEEFEWEGYVVPAGTMVVVSPIVTHHMPEWWTRPYTFDPLRFSPERAEDARHTHSWIPFGGGVHMCLGIRFAESQIRAIMHQLLLRYRWTVAEGYEMPVQQAPISKPKDGLPIRLERI
ncbi:MAG: cytochrome P450 [Deltaproteobacteria bacterium]|nr:cytochrome P450 [Deltaproteobacteria bacterium]MBW2362068.1 cytochrome P450 [Deltaproteobacteria bacterium]